MKLYEGWFSIDGKINDEDTNFIIDTGTMMNLAKVETLKDWNAACWGIYPAKSQNAYGQKADISLYYPYCLKIQSLSLGSPLFEAISSDNHIYAFLPKPVIGEPLLKACCWKFSMDNKEIVLFAKQDRCLFEQEIKGYKELEMGISPKCELTIVPLSKRCKMAVDLGFNGEIRINKQIFEQLSKQITFKKYLQLFDGTHIDTLFVAKQLDVQLAGFKVRGCQVVYSHRVNHCLIGSRFMQRFNFILAFGDFKKRLYLEPVNYCQQDKNKSFFSDYGFSMRKREIVQITLIEVGGLAKTAGLRLGDKVRSVDNGAFDLNTENLHDRLIKYLQDKHEVNIEIERDRRVMEVKIAKK